jgi:hypothetical protein
MHPTGRLKLGPKRREVGLARTSRPHLDAPRDQEGPELPKPGTLPTTRTLALHEAENVGTVFLTGAGTQRGQPGSTSCREFGGSSHCNMENMGQQ